MRPFQGGALFEDIFCYFCSIYIFVMLYCLFLADLLAGCFVCCSFLYFCHFPTWCSKSCMILDCFEFWPLPSSILYLKSRLTFWTSHLKLNLLYDHIHLFYITVLIGELIAFLTLKSKNHLNSRRWLRLLSILRRWFLCCWFIDWGSSHLFVGVLCLVIVLLCFTWCLFDFCKHLDKEERAGSFTLIVFLESCDCYLFWSSSLWRNGLLWSVWLWYFLTILI